MPSSLIYLCADASATNTITTEFKIKGLQNLTVGRLSQIHVLAKPHEPQFAYGGYKSNIEAFVAATIRKEKLLTNQEEYPLPETYTPTVPLPLPQVICKLKSSLSQSQVTKIIEKWRTEEISSIDVGKGGPAFEILNPSWRVAFFGLPQLAQLQCARVDKRAQVGDLQLLRPVYQFIDAFLATNTYPYKKEDYAPNESIRRDDVYLGKVVELRNEDNSYRVGYGDLGGKLLKAKIGSVTDNRKVDDMELNDLTPHIETERFIGNSVFVAKPSPLPSSTSWGSPADVPNLGGLVFPYFPGMLIYDLPGTRDIISRYLFRCLGTSSITCRDAYKALRNCLGSTLNTPQGLILGHVLKGVELSLDAQAQLYLLFDEKLYLGFCLLGSEFRVWAHGGWRDARSKDDLRFDLAEVTTPTQSLKELLDLLKASASKIETAFVERLTVKDINSGSKLLRVLGELEEAEEFSVEDDQRIVSLIGRCNLPSQYRSITLSNIHWALDQLTNQKDAPFDDDEPIYIPPTGWSDFNDKVYRVLAAFGPRSFSLRNATGDEITLLSQKDPAIKKYRFIQIDEKEREMYPFIVYSKTVKEAFKDWKTVVATGKVKMDFTERAGGVRGYKFFGKDKGTILKVLADAIDTGKLVNKQVEEKKTVAKKVPVVTDAPISDSVLDSIL
jgi:hypothetical protein